MPRTRAGSRSFSAQTGTQVLFAPDLTAGRRASAITGVMPREAALEQLLGCTSGSLCALADIEPPETLAGIDRLLRTQELADKHGLAVDTLLQLGKLPKAESYSSQSNVSMEGLPLLSFQGQ